MAENIVEDLKLPIQFVPSFGVQIGNGDVIRCNRICRNVEVQLPGLTINQNYFPFSIGGADLMLGIRWLASLNTVQANWNEMFLIFNLNGQKYKLQGVPHKTQTVATFQYLAKETDHSGNNLIHNPEIQNLLHEFESTFQPPNSLPPFRSHTHSIPLLPNSKPPTLGLTDDFLGLTGYNSKFVKNYGIIAHPLTDLTKKNAFQWSLTADKAFHQLKAILITVPILRLPNFSQPFTECDASFDKIGAILLQNDHPVAYFSKRFSFLTV